MKKIEEIKKEIENITKIEQQLLGVFIAKEMLQHVVALKGFKVTLNNTNKAYKAIIKKENFSFKEKDMLLFKFETDMAPQVRRAALGQMAILCALTSLNNNSVSLLVDAINYTIKIRYGDKDVRPFLPYKTAYYFPKKAIREEWITRIKKLPTWKFRSRGGRWFNSIKEMYPFCDTPSLLKGGTE